MPSRRLLRTALSLVALLACAPAPAAAAEAVSLPPIACEAVHLANGLRVLLAPDPQAHLASVTVTYDVGTGDDPDGRAGLAHVTEHLVAEATKHAPRVMGILESIGGTGMNASTRLDRTTYFETMPPERLDAALWVESDRMGFAADALSQTRLEAARAAVKNERIQTRVDGTLGSFDELTRTELFPAWHPYSSGEWANEVEHIEVDDVRSFLATWYGPANATLAIAGRFDRDATLAAVHRYFDPLPSTPPPVRPHLPAWSAPSLRLVLAAPVASQSVVFEWTTPPYGTRDDAVLDVISAVLSGSGNDRLKRALVTPGIASAVTSGQASFRERSIFRIVATIAPGANAGPAIAAVNDALEDLAQTVTPAEVERARRTLRFRNVELLETPWGRAMAMASLARIGLEPGTGFDWGLSRYDDVMAPDARRVVNGWLVGSPRVITAVFPDRTAPISGRLVARDEVGP
jgi:zinc protease